MNRPHIQHTPHPPRLGPSQGGVVAGNSSPDFALVGQVLNPLTDA